MNGDGIVTITDVWAWIGWLFYYPGDIAIYGMLKVEGFARFFELTPAYYGGVLSFFISFAFWACFWLVIAMIDSSGKTKENSWQGE